METDFATWLMREIEARGWTNAELARRAGISAASISMVVSGQKGVGLDFCLGVSRAFGQPPETVLRKAGLLPPIPAPVAEETEIITIIRSLPSNTRSVIVTMLRALAHGRLAVSPSPPRLDPLETQMLEVFRRLPDSKQDQILGDLADIENSRIMRLIGEEDETTQQEANAA